MTGRRRIHPFIKRITWSADAIPGPTPRFKVFYRRNGKLYFDNLYSGSAEKAKADFLAFARELKWTVEFIRVEAIS